MTLPFTPLQAMTFCEKTSMSTAALSKGTTVTI
jgi:hypothetical protein